LWIATAVTVWVGIVIIPGITIAVIITGAATAIIITWIVIRTGSTFQVSRIGLRSDVQVTFRIEYHCSAGHITVSYRVLDKNRAWIVRIAIAVPGPIAVPWTGPVIVSGVIVICIRVGEIIIIKGRPLITVVQPHSQVPVCIIIGIAPIIAVILLLCYNVLILRAYRRIIYVIRCLTGFVCSGATAEWKGRQRQE
jgi:hypothetical protein